MRQTKTVEKGVEVTSTYFVGQLPPDVQFELDQLLSGGDFVPAVRIFLDGECVVDTVERYFHIRVKWQGEPRR